MTEVKQASTSAPSPASHDAPIARALAEPVRRDLAKKLVILTGPRQSGKTTLARSLSLPKSGQETAGEMAQYLNWDVPADRDIILRNAWSARALLVVFDEIHKMPAWKAFLKGGWDGRSKGQQMLVTGSARMETFRQGGESLAGRYRAWRLHPFSVRELTASTEMHADAALGRLLERGGFPEPLFADDAIEADRWRAQYTQDLIREDVLEFSRVHEIKSMQLLLQLLRERVGTPVKVSRLAQMLQLSSPTVARHLEILEALFVVFRVTPWHRDIARSLLKEAKFYFYDTGLVMGDDGIRLENAVAGMLLKHAQFVQDSSGKEMALHTIRDKEGHEIDFVLAENGAVSGLIEVKWADATPSGFFHRTAERFPGAMSAQLVRNLRHEETRNGIRICRAHQWLNELTA